MKTVVIAALALVGLGFKGDLKLGEVVPDLELKSLDGKVLKLSEFRADPEKGAEGKVLVVYFQSEKCPSAVAPDKVKKIAEKYAEKDGKVAFLAVFAYGGDSEDGTKKFVEANGLKYPVVYDKGKKIAEHLGATNVNTTYVMDRQGKLVYRGGLQTKKKDLAVEAVNAALDGSRKAPESDQRFKG